jgi:hypothetical protein
MRPFALEITVHDFRLCDGSSPYRHQPDVYDSVVLAGTLNSAGGLLDRGGLIRRLSEAKEKRLCWRFCGRFEMIGFGGSGFCHA